MQNPHTQNKFKWKRLGQKGVLNMPFNIAGKCVCRGCSTQWVDSFDAQTNCVYTGFLAAAFLLIITVTSCEEHTNSAYTELWQRKLWKRKAVVLGEKSKWVFWSIWRGMKYQKYLFVWSKFTFLPGNNSMSFTSTYSLDWELSTHKK